MNEESEKSRNYRFFRDDAEFTMRDTSFNKFMSCVTSCNSTTQYYIHKRPSHFPIFRTNSKDQTQPKGLFPIFLSLKKRDYRIIQLTWGCGAVPILLLLLPFYPF